MKGSVLSPRLRKLLRWTALLLLGAAAAVLTVLGCQLALRLQDPAFREGFRQLIAGLHLWGVLAMLGIQVLQVVLAFIPGEPVEVLAGVLYGAFGGFLVCEAGVLLGQLAVFSLVRRYGAPVVELFFEKKSIHRFAFLHNTRRLEGLIFLLFFIPGTPKDILTYVAGLTPIGRGRFLFLSMVARIPSILSSTLAGATLGEGKLWVSLAIFGGIGLVGLGGIFLNQRLMARLEKSRLHHQSHREGKGPSGD